jgi:hypothetical protein
MRLHGPHLFKKLQRIEGAGDFAQFNLRGLRHTFGLQKSLTGCLWGMYRLQT